MRFWKRHDEPAARKGLQQATLQGASREELIEEAMAELVTGNAADRIGVWLDRNRHQGSVADPSFHGLVWDRENETTPREWRVLAPQAVLPSARLIAGAEIESLVHHSSTAPLVGPIVGLRKVVWVPVEHLGKLHGILMAGATVPQRMLPKEKMKSVATELAVALAFESERKVARERREDIALCNKILTSLEEGGEKGKLLQYIVESCVADAGRTDGPGAVAAGIALARNETGAATNELTIVCGVGDPAAQQALAREPVKELSRQALEKQRTMGSEVERSGSNQGLLRVVAVPLIAKAVAPTRVLLAGFRAMDASLSALERVEMRGRLAVAVLSAEHRSDAAGTEKQREKSLLEASRDAIVLTNAKGEPIATNRAARTLLSAPSETDREHRAAQDDVPPSGKRFADYFLARDRERVTVWLQRQGEELRDGETESPEFELECGARVRLHAREVEPRQTAITLLPSRATRLDEETRAEKELLGLSEWLDQGVVIFDAQEKVRLTNVRFAQLAGLAPAEVDRFKTLDSLIARLRDHSADPEVFAQRWLDLAKRLDGGEREEVHLVRPAARVLERASRPVFDAQGGRMGRIELYRDLTAQRVFQAQLLQTERLAALGQMVTGVAHELSNPLTSILGYAQRLLLRNNAEGNFEELRRIFSEAERAGAILRRLLLAARETTPERRPVSLNQLIQRTIELQRFSLAAERIHLEVSLEAQLPSVLGDAGQLQQVLINLIGNARQAIESQNNGGTIRVRTHHTEDNRVRMEIGDSGPGIAEGILARIFDPFFTTKPAGVGTGLGLAIVLSLVREHGGQVHVASPRGSGAVFTIELPVAEQREAGATESVRPRTAPSLVASESRAALPDNRDAMAYRVLVVEDEPTVAHLIADVLRDEGFEVETLLDGRAAPDRVSRGRFDLIVCDMKMPNLDGQSLYESLAPARKALQARFLFVTGDVMGAKTHAFLTKNRIPHVAKPFRVEELLEKVHQVLPPGDSSGVRTISPLRKNTATTG
jgi:signal transduction histidine kinase/CheY-like chemotaxis protein